MHVLGIHRIPRPPDFHRYRHLQGLRLSNLHYRFRRTEKRWERCVLSYPGVVKTYAIQAGRELRVIVGADKLSDAESESLSHDIAKKIQDEMTYPGQVKITVIRETRAVSYAK